MSGFDITMYRDMFVEEAEELFESADNVLLEAENNGSLTDDEMGQLFRDVHTLKGSGASVELAYFAEFTHDVENMMDKLRNHQIEFIPEMAGTLIDGLDVMKEILQMECDGSIDRENFTEKTSDLLVTIRSYINGEEVASDTPVVEPTKEVEVIATEEVKEVIAEPSSNVSSAWGFFGEESKVAEENNDDNNFGFFDDPENATSTETVVKENISSPEIEEVPVAVVEKKEATPKKVKSTKEAATAKKASPSTIRVNLDKIDLLMNNVGDLVITNAMLTQYSTTIKEHKVRTSVLERLESRFYNEYSYGTYGINLFKIS